MKEGQSRLRRILQNKKEKKELNIVRRYAEVLFFIIFLGRKKVVRYVGIRGESKGEA